MPVTPSTEPAYRVNEDPDFAARFITYMAQHPEVFDDVTWQTAEHFLFALVSGGAAFYTDETQGGAVWFTDIVPGASARGHCVAWDRDLYGREDVFRSAVQQVMQEYRLERVWFEIPAWLKGLAATLDRIGWITKEGYLRHVYIKNSQWEDALLYSTLWHEVNG